MRPSFARCEGTPLPLFSDSTVRVGLMIRFKIVFLLVILSTSVSWAQVPTISTVVGPSLPVDGTSATTQALDQPTSIAFDNSGGFYVTSRKQSRVYRIAPDGTLKLIAGSSWGFSGDGGAGTSAQLKAPSGVAVDTSGNVYIADTENQRIRKIATNGTITTVAGNGTFGFGGDGGPAVTARLFSPTGVAVDRDGNVYVADSGNRRIRRITTNGTISTIGGGGNFFPDSPLLESDAISAVSVQFRSTTAVTIGPGGNLYIVDTVGNAIWKMNRDGVLSSAAGNGRPACSRDAIPLF